MASFTITQNITEQLTKFQHFKKCIEIERKDEKSHFLWVGGITEAFLCGCSPTAEGKWGCNYATRYMLQAAIHEFYNDFDRALYDSFKSPEGLFTKIIWGKFRAFHKEWTVLHDANMMADGRHNTARERADRERGHMKRQAKEKQQMLSLGGGDLSLGRKRFEERMHVQKEVKLNKVNDVSLQTEEAFAAWLITQEFTDEYTKPIVDCAVKQFRTSEPCCYNTKIKTTNLKVNEFAGMLDALRQLATHPSAGELTIVTNLEWDTKVPFSNPHTHTYTGGSVLALANSGRVEQRQKVGVHGFLEKNGKFYIVSNQYGSAYRLFPKKFEKLEFRNPRISGCMSILYNVDLCLSHLTVVRCSGIVKHLMNISLMHNGNDTVDPTVIFQSHIVRELKTMSDDALTRKRNEKEHRNKIARRRGVVISNEKDRVSWSNHSFDTTGSIMKLCDMFANGLLDKEQFEAAKIKVLG
jgi:hypothetical protein